MIEKFKLPEPELPKWANQILEQITNLQGEMEEFLGSYSKEIKIRGSNKVKKWMDDLRNIKEQIINETTPPRPIRYEELLENIKDKPYDGSYITLLDKDELVLRAFRIKVPPAEIRNIETKEEPITVNMTKRYLEIITDDKTYTKPAPKGIVAIHLIDGRSATVVR